MAALELLTVAFKLWFFKNYQYSDIECLFKDLEFLCFFLIGKYYSAKKCRKAQKKRF